MEKEKDDFKPVMKESTKEDILFSKTVKAGKRIYYIDVKQDRRKEKYVTITESKRMNNTDENQPAVYEKHKVFVYPEDFLHFKDALDEAIGFASGKREEAKEKTTEGVDLNFDIDLTL